MRCKISGLLRDAEDAPCVKTDPPDGYVGCPIWQTEKERLWASRKPTRALQMIGADGWS